MRRLTLVTAALVIGVAACTIGLFSSAGPAGADQFNTNVYCRQVRGTTGGSVALTSCKARTVGMHPPNPGSGTIPGATFVGTSTGTVTWTAGANSFSTTVTVTSTRAPDVAQRWCGRLGSTLYYVNGTVTANDHPDITVGDRVFGALCISPAGVVRQTKYGSLLF